MCKFSIVVPVYNVERYLEHCIESVLQQTYQNYEVILVDDGSIDKSPEICDNYVSLDKRVRVIHQKNGGVSNARNAGILASRGENIIFLDADDKMAEQSLEKISAMLDENYVDLVVFSYNELYGDSTLKYVNVMAKDKNAATISDIATNYSAILDLTRTTIFHVWSKVFVRSTIIENDLFFDEALNSAEDCDFLFRYYVKSNNCYLSNLATTNYRVDRADAVTKNLTAKTVMSNLVAFKKCVDLFYDKDAKLVNYFANKFANIISTIHRVKTDEKTEIISFIKDNKSIVRYTKGLKYTIAKVFWSTFGFWTGSKILSKINYKRK